MTKQYLKINFFIQTKTCKELKKYLDLETNYKFAKVLSDLLTSFTMYSLNCKSYVNSKIFELVTKTIPLIVYGNKTGCSTTDKVSLGHFV